MKINFTFEIKPGKKVTEQELADINTAKKREWDIPAIDEDHRNSLS